jgi:hypothetical protein
MASCLFGLFPSFVLGEVCMRGAFDSQLVPPSLHGCDPGFAFEDIFGVSRVFVNSVPDFTASKSGRPQIGFRLEPQMSWEDLSIASQGKGLTLENAAAKYEAALRKIMCRGHYDEFLNAGGSLHVSLTASKNVENSAPGDWPFENAKLIDIEIDTPNDCEAP